MASPPPTKRPRTALTVSAPQDKNPATEIVDEHAGTSREEQSGSGLLGKFPKELNPSGADKEETMKLMNLGLSHLRPMINSQEMRLTLMDKILDEFITSGVDKEEIVKFQNLLIKKVDIHKVDEDMRLTMMDKILDEFISSGVDKKEIAERQNLFIKKVKTCRADEDVAAGAARHFSCASNRKQFSSRFKNVNIVVNERFIPPTLVWYQNEGDEERRPEDMYEVSVLPAEQDFLPSNPEKIWSNPPMEKQAYLNIVHDHILEATRNLKLQINERRERSWALCCESSSNAGNSKNALSPEVVGRMSANMKIMTAILGVQYNDVIVQNFHCLITDAFTEGMHNSAGRSGMVSFLEFACRVAFGYDCIRKSDFTIHSVGTSPYPPEGFPVSVHGFRRDDKDLHDLRSVSEMSAPRHMSDVEGYSVQSRDSSSSSFKYLAGGKSLIFPDLFVSTRDNSGWAKYLLFCEVKPGYREFTDSNKAQLVRQLVAGCMHQSQVFGLLINAKRALLIGITHKKHNQLIQKTYAEYYFETFSGSGHRIFAGEYLKKLMSDLIVVLEYAKANVVEVRPSNLM